MAVTIRDRNGTGSLYIVDTAKGNPSKLTFDRQFKWAPVWSPDAKSLYHVSAAAPGKTEIFRTSSNGAMAQSSSSVIRRFGRATMSRRMERGYFTVRLTEGKTSLSYGLFLWIRVEVEASAYPLQPAAPTSMSVSPDGRWVAYTYNETGPAERLCFPLSHPHKAKRQVSPGEGLAPRWRRDGKELFFVAQDNVSMMAACK